MKYLAVFTLCLLCSPVFSAPVKVENLPALSTQYDMESEVLIDFVESYNFKCPTELSQEQLLGLLSETENDTGLSTMLESSQMQSRDLYVEARSMISCFTKGSISKGY